MEYLVEYYNGKTKDGFKNLQQARKNAYANVKYRQDITIYKRSATGNEYIVGEVMRTVYPQGILYKEHLTDKCWVLNKDGTLGKKVKW